MCSRRHVAGIGTLPVRCLRAWSPTVPAASGRTCRRQWCPRTASDSWDCSSPATLNSPHRGIFQPCRRWTTPEHLSNDTIQCAVRQFVNKDLTLKAKDLTPKASSTLLATVVGSGHSWQLYLPKLVTVVAERAIVAKTENGDYSQQWQLYSLHCIVAENGRWGLRP